LIFSPNDVIAGTSEETYNDTVRQLNQEGFQGIDRALKVFEELIQKSPTAHREG